MNRDFIESARLTGICKQLITENAIASQKELQNALCREGVMNISQTRLSRLLAKIGATKVSERGKKRVYRLPNPIHAPKCKQSLESMVISVSHNSQLVVVNTVAGSGMLVKKIIEGMHDPTNNNRGTLHWGSILTMIADEQSVIIVPANIDNVDAITDALASYFSVT